MRKLKEAQRALVETSQVSYQRTRGTTLEIKDITERGYRQLVEYMVDFMITLQHAKQDAVVNEDGLSREFEALFKESCSDKDEIMMKSVIQTLQLSHEIAEDRFDAKEIARIAWSILEFVSPEPAWMASILESREAS
ncbi:MAG: hypothetical protein AAF449_20020 [Myxococcota bacterium]